MSENADPEEIRLGANLPGSEMADRFRAAGRLQIDGILDNRSAEVIRECLAGFSQWSLVFNCDGRHVDTDAADVATWTDDQRRKLEDMIYSQAESGFQYYYKTVPIYDIYHGGRLPGHLLNRVFEFLNAEPFLGLMRAVTGDPTIAFADAQATCYERGHFLTRHDDNVAGKNRRAAYVLNLSRGWNADWGGALQFFDEQGNVEGGFAPAFNVLNLFRVPASHSVGVVAPFATGSRYSITGWLRSGVDPGC